MATSRKPGSSPANDWPAGTEFAPAARSEHVPESTVRRLSTYYRLLQTLAAQSEGEQVSSGKIAALTGFTAAQVRRDLAYFGTFGRRGVGYENRELQRSLATILGIDRGWRIALVGVGNLGQALLSYRGFPRQGFHVVAAFDRDPQKVGQIVRRVRVRPMSALPAAVRSLNLQMAVIAVPADSAQEVAAAVVAAGITGILNFAPTKLAVPEQVHLQNVDLSIEIEYLSYLLTHEASADT